MSEANKPTQPTRRRRAQNGCPTPSQCSHPEICASHGCGALHAKARAERHANEAFIIWHNDLDAAAEVFRGIGGRRRAAERLIALRRDGADVSLFEKVS